MVLDLEPAVLVKMPEGSVRLGKPPLEDWVLFKAVFDRIRLEFVLVERLALDKLL